MSGVAFRAGMAGRLSKVIFDADSAYLLSVLQIFGEQPGAFALYRGTHNQRVPPGQFFTGMNRERCLQKTSAGFDPKERFDRLS